MLSVINRSSHHDVIAVLCTQRAAAYNSENNLKPLHLIRLQRTDRCT